MDKIIQALLKALAQHTMCSIARDAGGKYPNPNRVGRQVLNMIDTLNQVSAMGQGQTINPLSSLAGLLQQGNEVKQPDVGAMLVKIDARLAKLEARK